MFNLCHSSFVTWRGQPLFRIKTQDSQPEPSPIGLLVFELAQQAPKSQPNPAHFSLSSSFSEKTFLLTLPYPPPPTPPSLTALPLTGGPCWGTYGLVALNHQRQLHRCHGMEGGQVQALDVFGDTVSHLPDCCSFIRIGVGCGRALSQPPLSAEAPLRL